MAFLEPAYSLVSSRRVLLCPACLQFGLQSDSRSIGGACDRTRCQPLCDNNHALSSADHDRLDSSGIDTGRRPPEVAACDRAGQQGNENDERHQKRPAPTPTRRWRRGDGLDGRMHRCGCRLRCCGRWLCNRWWCDKGCGRCLGGHHDLGPACRAEPGSLNELLSACATEAHYSTSIATGGSETSTAFGWITDSTNERRIAHQSAKTSCRLGR